MPREVMLGAGLKSGSFLFVRYCGICHSDAAAGGTVITDLRYSSLLRSADSWKMVVYDGILSGAGVVSWAPVMSAEQADTIRYYVIQRANEDKTLMAAP